MQKLLEPPSNSASFLSPSFTKTNPLSCSNSKVQLAERQEGSCIYCELTGNHARNKARTLASCFLAANLIPGGPKIILPQPQNFHPAAYTLQIRIAGGPKIWTLARRLTLKGWWIGFATPARCLRWLLGACSTLAQQPFCSVLNFGFDPWWFFAHEFMEIYGDFPPKMAPNNEVFRRGHLYWLIPYLSENWGLLNLWWIPLISHSTPLWWLLRVSSFFILPLFFFWCLLPSLLQPEKQKYTQTVQAQSSQRRYPPAALCSRSPGGNPGDAWRIELS